MFKKINDKLISQYPLLWNTKVVFILPLCLIIHLLFYVSGRLYPVYLDSLWDLYDFNGGSEITFSILISAIIVILWLVHYLRNNPFKSFYTLSKGYMFKEFMLMVVIFFSSSTFFLSFKQGLYDNIDSLSSEVNIEDDANQINLAAHFIAFDYGDFSVYGCCDSIEARRVRDSIENEYKKTLNPRELEDYNRKQLEIRNATESYTDTINNSYLFYCKLKVEAYNYYPQIDITDNGFLNTTELNNIALRWLQNHKKDSVLRQLNILTNLCDKYGVRYNFNPNIQLAECFNDNHFTVRKTVSDYYIDSVAFLNGEYEDDYNEYVREYLKTQYYIETYNLQTSLQRIATVRDGFWKPDVFIIWLYFAIGASIILFSFRATRLKHWFVGIIGIGLWAILLTLVEVTAHVGKGFPTLLILIWIGLLIFMYAGINNKGNKLITGFVYNWVLWFAPLVIPLIFVAIEIATDNDCYFYNEMGEKMIQKPGCEIHHWINEHWYHIGFSNMAATLALIWLVFIPQARKWQSNPEE